MHLKRFEVINFKNKLRQLFRIYVIYIFDSSHYQLILNKSINLSMNFKFTFSMVLWMIGLSVAAQQTAPTMPLTHWMTPDEILRKHEIGKNFVPTAPPPAPVFSVAEFMPSEEVLIRYPFGIPMSLIKDLAAHGKMMTIVKSESEKTTVINQYTSNGVNLANCEFLITQTDSYWTRDFGPWYVIDADYRVGIVDFPYNRPRPNDDEVPKVLANQLNVPLFGMNVSHTGGNYMSDGISMAASTDLVWEENGNDSTTVKQLVKDFLGIEKYHVRPDPNNTYIDHIDCWAKFLDTDKILIRSVPQSHPQYDELEVAAAYWQSAISSYGTPYQVFRVNTPNNEPYTNSLILNKYVYVPIKGSANDAPALAVYRDAMPGYTVTGYIGNASTPWESTDALHCRTHEMADRGMLLIRHIPILTQKPADEDYLIQTDIIPISQRGLYADSCFVNYSVNQGAWQKVALTHESGYIYKALIPRQLEGSQISYYIHAADSSGRSENHPYIGQPDPHKFVVGPAIHPHIAYTPSSIDTLTEPGVSVSVTIELQNTGAASLDWSFITATGASWIVPTQSTGVIAVGGTSSVVVNLNPGSLTTGTLDGYLKIASNDPDRELDSIHVVLKVTNHIGIESVSMPAVALYPNPSNGVFDILLDANIAGRAVVRLISSNGEIFGKMLSIDLKEGENKISSTMIAENLPAGIYFLQLSQKGHQLNRKIVITN